MTYMKVKWSHSSSDYPVLLYSELDADRWEKRKVEIYADGRADFAGQNEQTGKTELGIVPVPDIEDIAAQPEFEPATISAQEFEAAWRKAREGRQSGA
jgi:hypothetical protein